MAAANHLTTTTKTAPSPDEGTVIRERRRHASSWEADADTHLIRLCLDLQLDAMLLTLGAASAGPGSSDSPPWIRWLNEDMQMACTLAGGVMDGGAALPPTLGSDLDHLVPAAAVDNLVARYESMIALLNDVLQPRPDSSAQERPRIREVRERCERRLRELQACRLEHTPPRGLHVSDPPPRSYLPGEMLG